MNEVHTICVCEFKMSIWLPLHNHIQAKLCGPWHANVQTKVNSKCDRTFCQQWIWVLFSNVQLFECQDKMCAHKWHTINNLLANAMRSTDATWFFSLFLANLLSNLKSHTIHNDVYTLYNNLILLGGVEWIEQHIDDKGYSRLDCRHK